MIWPNISVRACVDYACVPVCEVVCVGAEASILPWGHNAFPPCFRFPSYFRKKFRLCGQFLQFYLFQKNFSIFIRQNFWWPFSVIDHKFRISPYFSLFQYISLPLFRENYSPPYFDKFPPVLEKFTCFLHALCVFRFPPTLTMMHLCITQCTYWTPLRRCV